MKKLSILFILLFFVSFKSFANNVAVDPNLLFENEEQLADPKDVVKNHDIEINELSERINSILEELEELSNKYPESILPDKKKIQLDFYFKSAKENEKGKLRFFADCWELSKTKLNILDLYLFDKDQSLTSLEYLDFKINLFDQFFYDMDCDINEDRNNYVTDIIKKLLPSRLKTNKILKLLKKLFKGSPELELLLTTDFKAQTEFLEDFNYVLDQVSNYFSYNDYSFNDEEERKSILLKLTLILSLMENYNYAIQEKLFLEDINNDEIKNLESIKKIFDLLQNRVIGIVKTIKFLPINSESVDVDGEMSRKDPLIRVKFEGIESDLIVDVVKKLLSEFTPSEVLKLILNGGWKKFLSMIKFGS